MSLDTVARGARIVRAQMLAFMQAELPAQLALARTEWDHTPASLPDPREYSPYDPPVIEDKNTPCLVAGVGRTRSFRRTGIGPGGEQEYQARYTASLTVWVKRERRFAVQQIRDDYVSVITSLLLATPGLNGGGAFRLDESTLEASYSEAAKLTGDRYLAGGTVAFELEHDESVRRVPLGVVESTDVAATVLPATHPGL